MSDAEGVEQADPSEQVEELEDDESLRWYVVAAFMGAVVVGFVLAALLTVYWIAGCEDAGARNPHIAGDSPRAALCTSGHGAGALLVPAGWVLGLVLATIALARWGRGRVVLLAALFVAPLLLPVAAYAGMGLTSTSCTGEKLAAYREFAESGDQGSNPYDCRKF